MIPERLTRPTVGLIPTMPLNDEGETMEPSVSVPIAAAQRFAATATADPELEPEGFRSSAYGFFVWPPRPLQPLVDREDRKLAHSLRLVFPRITAPAARSLCATNESRGASDPRSAKDPAVVIIRSPVSRLSLSRIGTPCRRPRGPLALRSLSSARAIASASGLISITALSAGPLRSISAMRWRYFFVSEAAVSWPDFIAAWRSEIVASSNTTGLRRDREGAARGRSSGLAGAGRTNSCPHPSAVICRKLLRFIVYELWA